MDNAYQSFSKRVTNILPITNQLEENNEKQTNLTYF